MATYRGMRNLGRMDPVERGNLQRLGRSLRLTAASVNRNVPSQETQNRVASATIGIGSLQFGKSADRPQAISLLKSGTSFLLYFATDTNVLSGWNGVAWKTTTLT